MTDMSDQVDVTVSRTQIIQVALEALSMRLLSLIALLLSAALFFWALGKGGWDSVATAVLFSGAAWCIIRLSPARSNPL